MTDLEDSLHDLQPGEIVYFTIVRACVGGQASCLASDKVTGCGERWHSRQTLLNRGVAVLHFIS